MHDTTDILRDYLHAWEGIGVDIDAVYSGFLGAPEQVDVIRSLYERFPNALRMVDPVMADHGKVYPTYTPELCEAMASLARDADILTPNLTEAAIILGEPIGDEWAGTDISDEGGAPSGRRARPSAGRSTWCSRASNARAKNIIRNFIGGVDTKTCEVSNEYLPLHAARHGRRLRLVRTRRRHGGSQPEGRGDVRRRFRPRRHGGLSAQPNFRDRASASNRCSGRCASC